ncbi:MAG: hypothetical protein QOG09_873, partial [Solirubrobacterales bacterium]|nr:hypothetical protein [Solirubrobacterales bacterium]
MRSPRLAAVLACALLVSTAAIARADDPIPGGTPDPTAAIPQDPGEACQQQVNQTAAGNATQGAGCDNKYTPVAKDGQGIGWSQIAGQVHPDAAETDAYLNSVQNQVAPIPPTVDFYTVSFANSSLGFAGGAQCQDDAPERARNASGGFSESNRDYQDRISHFLDTCLRVPVIYRYTDNGTNGPFWERAYKGDSPGYVGAISWLHNLDTREHGLRALALGGDTTTSAACPKSETNPPYPRPEDPARAHCGGYPRREPAIPDDPSNPNDANCTEEGATNAKVADVDPSKPPKTALSELGARGDFGPVKVHSDPREAFGACEARWRQAHDPAGKARAWLYSDSHWDDLGSAGQGLPASMHGLTALDASFDPGTCDGAQNECAFAGGLQQIWMWRDGDFSPLAWRPEKTEASQARPVSLYGETASGPCESSWQCEWNFRVRAIRFDPSQGGGATAVTSGCCSNAHDPTLGYGRAIKYQRGANSWTVYGQTRADPHLADSYYAISEYPDGSADPGSRLATPGGPETSNEAPAQVVPSSGTGGGLNATVVYAGADATHHRVDSVRLVAGDGDVQGHQVGVHERAGGLSTSTGTDGLMDWAVGGSKANGRASAFTTTRQTYTPAGVD